MTTRVSRSWLRTMGIAFLAWTALAVLSMVQVRIATASRGQPMPWSLIVPGRLLDWYSCALFTPALLWLVRSHPLDARRWAQRVPLYLAVTGACVVLKYALMVAIVTRVQPSVRMTLGQALSQEFLLELMILWGAIAVLHAADFRERLVQREQDALELRAQLSEAQLDALKGQLQPHFLFNTLNGVASLIHTNPAAADQIVVQLADLLRASLDHGGAREITLAQELVLLDKYLAIMRARFGERVTIVRDVDPSVTGALVPQFLLQPIVENAFEHGLARRAGAGRIVIRATMADGGRLRLEVRDDGDGVPTGGGAEGVGLGNSRRRLAELYGSAQSLTLTSIAGGGALTAVEMPLRPA